MPSNKCCPCFGKRGQKHSKRRVTGSDVDSSEDEAYGFPPVRLRQSRDDVIGAGPVDAAQTGVITCTPVTQLAASPGRGATGVNSHGLYGETSGEHSNNK